MNLGGHIQSTADTKRGYKRMIRATEFKVTKYRTEASESRMNFIRTMQGNYAVVQTGETPYGHGNLAMWENKGKRGGERSQN